MSRQAPRTISLVVVLAILLSGSCRSGRNDPAATQENFGVRMARMNLWREAMFRFKRAVEMNPEDAMAHNNLAVAYEANGDFDSALKEYREAIRLDKSNQYIQKNYSRFVEFTSRNKKRQRTPPVTTASTTTSAEGDAPATTPPTPEPPPPVPPPPTPTPEGVKP